MILRPLCFALLLSASAGAQTVTFNLHGTVTSSGLSTFVVGNPVVWSVTINTGASVAGSSPGVWAGYYALTQVTFNYNNGEYSGTHVFSSPAPVMVYDSAVYDDFIGFNDNTGPFSTNTSATVSTFPTVEGNQVKFGYNFLRLRATGYSANDSTALVSPVGQNWFGGAGADIWSLDIPGGVEGSFTSASAIPEPSTYAIIFGGIALVGAVFFRQRVFRSGRMRPASRYAQHGAHR